MRGSSAPVLADSTQPLVVLTADTKVFAYSIDGQYAAAAAGEA